MGFALNPLATKLRQLPYLSAGSVGVDVANIVCGGWGVGIGVSIFDGAGVGVADKIGIVVGVGVGAGTAEGVSSAMHKNAII